MSDTRVAGIVLAAGASRRLGAAKQLLTDESGRTLVVRAAMQLQEAGCAPVLVVTGAGHDAVSRMLDTPGVTVVFNAEWAEGMGASIRCAMAWLDAHAPAAADAVIITACDMPSVTASHLAALRSAWEREHARIASAYDAPSGARVLGIPALFPREDWSALRALSGDRGARGVLSGPGTGCVVLPNGGFDLDWPDDVQRWRAGIQGE